VTVDYRGASAAAIQRSYDLPTEFYACWLDETLTYTCGLWDLDDPADTLADAQRRKLDYLISGARAAGAARVLDVGCGWGSLLERLTGTHGVRQAVGVTLSETQAAWIRDRALDRVEVRVENWADHVPDGRYDAIVSIGAFEHFARFGLTRAERVAGYREFFDRCRSWLPAGGRLALQTCVKGNNTRMDRQTVRDLMFIVETVFTESEIPWLSEVVEASERYFDVVRVRNDPDHYARTSQRWHDNLVARRAEATALVGPGVVADYERYLGASVGHFQRRHLGLARLVFEAV
jgi:cyclopropane-fatty-acyl-phospholipid synthase